MDIWMVSSFFAAAVTVMLCGERKGGFGSNNGFPARKGVLIRRWLFVEAR
jgi:hypothetical protein